MSLRRKSRELALQCLYQGEQGGSRESDIVDLAVNFQVDKQSIAYAQEIVEGVRKSRQVLDEVIEKHARNWRMERMTVIDRNLLRIAVFELLHKSDIPGSVVINEALEIARRFSADDAVSFINGILDPISRDINPDTQEGER